MKKTICILFLTLLMHSLLAQNCVSINLGTDFSLVTFKVLYFHDLKVEQIDRNIRFNVDFLTPLLKPDLKDFKIQTGASMDIIKYSDFSLPLKLNFVGRGTSNSVYDIVGFGSEITLSPGYYGESFHIASEFILDNQWFSYVTYSKRYKELVFENAKEGWMGLSSTTIRLGLNTALIVNKNIELLLLGGWEYHGEYNFKVPPFYVTLGSNIIL